jgi:hypothetical protein
VSLIQIATAETTPESFWAEMAFWGLTLLGGDVAGLPVFAQRCPAA